jgi:signal transduction histidine kinase
MASLVDNALLASDRPVQVLISENETLPELPPLHGSRSAVSIAIMDQGSGIPEEVLHRIGEPFFTTRETGKGMGLGVYLARSLVSQLGGQLQFESEAGVGTTVTVTLPLQRDRLTHPG